MKTTVVFGERLEVEGRIFRIPCERIEDVYPFTPERFTLWGTFNKNEKNGVEIHMVSPRKSFLQAGFPEEKIREQILDNQ